MPADETTPARPLATIWEIPDDLWEEIAPILDCFYPKARAGRPRADLRRVLDGIIHRLRSGCQWNHIPERFGGSSTVHGWFQRFTADGFLEEIWAYLVYECDELGGVCWEWQAADGVMGKSRHDGALRGPNPTDRAKMGTKKSVLVDQHGGPLAAVIAGANVHDTKLLAQTIEAIVVARPDPRAVVQNLCLDKGYDNPTGRAACAANRYVAHIRRIGEEKLDRHGHKSKPARRWVVERTLSWLQHCRALLVRYEKHPTNYLGLIQLACALLWYRRRRQLQDAQHVSG